MTEYKYWIALEQSKGIGPANLKTIYEAVKTTNLSISDIFDLTPQEIKEEFSFNENLVHAISKAKESLPVIEENYIDLLDAGIETIVFFENSYPKRFIDILGTSCPPILHIYGDKEILNKRGAAILGEAEVSEKGKNIAYLAAGELAKHRIVTISGLAKGVDQIAHFSALENGGKTIAILPYGIKNLKTDEILQKIPNIENLLLVSPFFPDIEYNKYNAYIRNRLICALSYAVYIVETPEESGIMEAAKSANKLKIPLFVTEYAKYPESALANRKLMDEFNASPVKGKMVNKVLTPNLDNLIGIVKFSET